jgi:PAS domain S-box-containing protein
MITKISPIFKITVDDSDVERRQKLLNYLLTGTMAAALVMLAWLTWVALVERPAWEKISLLVVGSFCAILASVGIFGINLSKPRLASILFLVALTAILALADAPADVAAGRSTFVFTLPVVAASMLLAPSASFAFALFGSAVIVVLALGAQIPPNIPAVIGYFLLALISWLSSRVLEQALGGLRKINAEVEQRVADRTRELSESLAREANQSSQRQAILQGIADGVVVFDQSGLSILVNPALGHLLGVSIDQILQRPAENIFASAEHISEDDRASILDLIQTSAPAPVRIRWGERTLAVKAAPVQSAHGAWIGTVAVFRDFTQEAEVEEMKNSFVAMVSHELRTPLNAILGYSEMTFSGYYGPLNEKQDNVLQRIYQNSRRLLDIVSDLLDKAQIEAGHLRLETSTVSPAELLENLHSVMDKIAHDKGLELYSNLAPEMPVSLEIDPKRIQQIMINLVNNAVKFTDTGSITVRVYRVEAYWAFDVTDTGPGIAIEDQKYIFEPFRQVDKTITRSHGGIGLGLSIVKRLVDLMGGRIFLKSIVGQGSTFTVIFPLIQSERKSQ